MRKRAIIIIAILIVFALCVGLWFFGYHNRKSSDNLPALTSIAQMEEAEVNELLAGYHREQLIEVWGVPTSSRENEDIWQIDDITLTVNSNNKGKVVVCGVSKGTEQSAQTGQTSSARLLSVDVKVIEVVNDTTFTVEALADCSDKISTGDIISVSTDFESIADILGNYQKSNHFNIYFPNVGETDAGLSLTCFDAVQYDADGECLELPDIERTEEPDEYPPTTIVPVFDLSEPNEPTE